jgi:hypothetical protein
MGARCGPWLAGGRPERPVALIAPLPQHRSVSRREPAVAGQRGADDRLQPGVVKRYLVQVGIGAAAAGKGDRPVLGPELAEAPRAFSQRNLAMIASATWEVPTAVGSSRSFFMS